MDKHTRIMNTTTLAQDTRSLSLQMLHQRIRELAVFEETNDLIVSCYLPLKDGRPEDPMAVEERIRTLNNSLTHSGDYDAARLSGLNEALDKVGDHLRHHLTQGDSGIAIFSRGGDHPYFMTMEFKVPLPLEISADPLPNIYRLVELKDVFNRYLIVLSNENSGRIMEVNLGEVTESVFTEMPALRNRVGREWTKQHYQNHRRERGDKFVKEKIRILEGLIRSRGLSHLILAGQPHLTKKLREALPKSLQDILIDESITAGSGKISEVISQSLDAFIKEEQRESADLVQKLKRSLATDGLACLGRRAAKRALSFGQVDTLLLSQQMTDEKTREELSRIAVQQNIPIETVGDSKLLDHHHGVGCLLRFRMDYD